MENASTPTFEEKMAELEKVISSMESGKLSLNELVAKYEKCAVMLGELEKELDSAEQKLTVLQGGREEKMHLDDAVEEN